MTRRGTTFGRNVVLPPKRKYFKKDKQFLGRQVPSMVNDFSYYDLLSFFIFFRKFKFASSMVSVKSICRKVSIELVEKNSNILDKKVKKDLIDKLQHYTHSAVKIYQRQKGDLSEKTKTCLKQLQFSIQTKIKQCIKAIQMRKKYVVKPKKLPKKIYCSQWEYHVIKLHTTSTGRNYHKFTRGTRMALKELVSARKFAKISCAIMEDLGVTTIKNTKALTDRKKVSFSNFQILQML